MGNCQNRNDKNLDGCNCTYPRKRHGICCEHIEYHRKQGELPTCYFNKNDEATFNRSVEFYMKSSSHNG